MNSQPSRTYYEILEAPEDATFREITAARHRLSRQYHPDTFSGAARSAESTHDKKLIEMVRKQIREAEEELKLVNEAYGVLSDPKRRREYDEKLGELANADSKPGPSFNDYMNEGDFHSDNGDWEDAADSYTNAINLDPEHPHVGEAYLKRGYARWMPEEDAAADDFVEGLRRARYAPWLSEPRSERWSRKPF